MSQLLLQALIVVAFSALCFGCGYLVAFIVTRNKWRDEMIKRGAASADRQMGMARAAKETEGVGSAMIQSAADCGQHTNLPDLL